jgi:hypothetical protein
LSGNAAKSAAGAAEAGKSVAEGLAPLGTLTDERSSRKMSKGQSIALRNLDRLAADAATAPTRKNGELQKQLELDGAAPENARSMRLYVGAGTAAGRRRLVRAVQAAVTQEEALNPGLHCRPS